VKTDIESDIEDDRRWPLTGTWPFHVGCKTQQSPLRTPNTWIEKYDEVLKLTTTIRSIYTCSRIFVKVNAIDIGKILI
jgi:hypothetical protein